uniref:NADH dehydrogenase subunit 1 n=1 Tax=Romanomermis culicivorax TaxID=13658 RepID=A0A915KQ71_ROMCU
MYKLIINLMLVIVRRKNNISSL